MIDLSNSDGIYSTYDYGEYGYNPHTTMKFRRKKGEFIWHRVCICKRWSCRYCKQALRRRNYYKIKEILSLNDFRVGGSLVLWTLGTSITPEAFTKTKFRRIWTNFYDNFIKKKKLKYVGTYEFGLEGRKLHFHIIFNKTVRHSDIRSVWRKITGEKSNVHFSDSKDLRISESGSQVSDEFINHIAANYLTKKMGYDFDERTCSVEDIVKFQSNASSLNYLVCSHSGINRKTKEQKRQEIEKFKTRHEYFDTHTSQTIFDPNDRFRNEGGMMVFFPRDPRTGKIQTCGILDAEVQESCNDPTDEASIINTGGIS